MHIRVNVAINYDRGNFAMDNVTEGFSLYLLEDMKFLHEYPTGKPTKWFPKQVEFSEEGQILVGGSDHSTIYIFDRKTGLVMDTLNHKDNGQAQAVMVSILLR